MANFLLMLILFFTKANPTKVAVTLCVGQTMTDTAQGHGGGYWVSSNTSVATFGTTFSNATITGVAPGNVDAYYIKWGNVLDSVSVTVNDCKQ